MTSVHVVAVENRLDGLYAFADEEEAARFLEAVEGAGGSGLLAQLPVNLTADALIASEVEE